jgi:hypothetical protein
MNTSFNDMYFSDGSFGGIIDRNCPESSTDGNCFLTTVNTLNDGKKITRSDLAEAFCIMHPGSENDRDTVGLRTDGVYVDIWVGPAALAALTGERVILATNETAMEVLPNGAVQYLDVNDMPDKIANAKFVITFNHNHFRPVLRENRERFAEAYVEHLIEHQNEQNAFGTYEQLETNNREQILFDEIETQFTGANRTEAIKTVKEILSYAKDDGDKNRLISMLLDGIVAQAKLENISSAKSVAFAQTETRTSDDSLHSKMFAANSRANELNQDDDYQRAIAESLAEL